MDLKIEILLKEIQTSLEEMKSKQKPSENFNIFETLGVELLEARHSKFLAELLNPSGSHGCKDLFLKQFLLLDPIKEKIKDIDFFCEYAKVETEQFHIVEKNQSYIDIVIESKDTVIVIENKIYASDQYKQLYRYYKAKKSENFSNIILIYLTLDGKVPNEQSLNKLLSFDDIDLLSYETHINEWLLSTLEFIEFENIKIALNQYLSTIEKLTNKNSKEENKMIADKLMKNNNLQTAIKIADALPRAKAIFEMEFYKKLQIKLNESLQDFEIYPHDGFFWNFDEKGIKCIKELRKSDTKKGNDGFNGLYFYKVLKNGKYLFLKIGDDYNYRLYCECFLCTKIDYSKIQKIRKTDFKDTYWVVQDDYKIVIEGEDFPTVSFSKKNDEIYMKSNDEIDEIIGKIGNILSAIIDSDNFKELENIMEKN